MAHRIRRRPATSREEQGERGLEALRGLLVGPERKRLTAIEARPAVEADDVAGVLPQAVVKTTQAHEDELAASLEPAVARNLRTLAHRESELLGEILAPTIGAAVRKAVSDALAAMLQRFNEALERSLSARSLRWRIEASRTGRPFAEVVLLHTLVFRVEQVFLIHPGSGLLLEHVTDPSAVAPEPDQVTAMLEAIDSYVREAFGPLPEHLSQAKFGDHVIWVDRSSKLAIAAVVRGAAPQAFGGLLRETRERILLTHEPQLARFTSDVSPFATARPELQQCLKAQRTPPPQRARYWLVAAGVALAVALGALANQALTHHRQVADTVAALATEPGIAVTSARWADRQVHLSGFRDPLARPVGNLLAAERLEAADVRLQPFQSLDPRIVVKRAEQSLQPPRGATLSLAGGTLSAEGVAPGEWIQRARLLSPTIAGVERYTDSELRSREDVDALAAAARALERAEVHFDFAAVEPRSESDLRRAAARALQLRERAERARLPTCTVVTGYTDPVGSAELNQALSEARAAEVVDALAARGIPAGQLTAVGGGVRSGVSAHERGRRVTFQVNVGSPICAGPS